MENSTSKYKKFDVLDFVKTEECAKGYIEVSAEGDAGLKITVERVDDAWEVVNQAAQHHGFPITPAITEAYAKARAIAESHTLAFKFRAFLRRFSSSPRQPEAIAAK